MAGPSTLMSEEPSLQRGSADGAVRFDGCILVDPPAPDEDEVEEEEEDVLGEEGDAWEEEEVELEELYDSDYDVVGGGGGDLVTAPFVPEGEFLVEQVLFDSAGNIAGFVRVDAEEAAGGQEEEGREILVLYRYTRFIGTWSMEEGEGVKASSWTKLHRLRFIVPPAGDIASSLPLVGSSLTPLIYPELYCRQLHALWSRLVKPVSIPPQATRVQVRVDVGILRPRDLTPERMEHMRRELEMKREEAWPRNDTGMELHLPEPVLCKEEEEEAGDVRPAKRRKVVTEVAGQDCPICLEELEHGPVTWPGCSLPHVFHGECLERSLRTSVTCPLCRRELSL